jgi:hypothetical protein
MNVCIRDTTKTLLKFEPEITSGGNTDGERNDFLRKRRIEPDKQILIFLIPLLKMWID